MRIIGKYFFITLLAVGIGHLSALANYVPVECVSGGCSLNVKVNGDDLNKVFPSTYSGYRVLFDATDLVQAGQSEHFKILVYSKTSSGVELISNNNITVQPKVSKRKNTLLTLDIPQFTGTKVFWMDFYKTNGDLSSTYKVTLNGYGTASAYKQANNGIIYGQNLSSLISPEIGVSFPNSVLGSTSCPDTKFNECNLQKLFFHKFSVEASTVQDLGKTSVLRDSDGTFKLKVPVVASTKWRDRTLGAHKRDSHITLKDPKISQDPNLVDNEPVSLSQVDELNVGSSLLTNFSIDEVNNELEIAVADASQPLILRSSAIAFNGKEPRAILDLDSDELTNVPSLRFANAPLVSSLRNGSFEFDGVNLYFTANGQREFIMQSINGQYPSRSAVVNVKALLAGNADTLQTKDSLLFQNASNFDSGTINISRLPPNLTIDQLFNQTTGHSLTLRGADNIVLNSQLDTNLHFPVATSGTLATLSDINSIIGPNSVNTSHILDENLLAEDFSNSSIGNSKIQNLDATDISSGLVNSARLPNHEISNVNNLATTLADKLEAGDLVDNLLSTATDKALSANQAKLLKDQIDALPRAFDSINQNLATENIDFSKYHSVFKKTVSSATNFTASGLSQGHRAYLLLQGTTPNFPAYFNLIEGAYDPNAINVVLLEVINPSPSPSVNMKVFNFQLADFMVSVRKINPVYNGPCLKVRRDSDNAEQDIYFTNSGNLDLNSLLAFTGAANAFVSKWYDQSLNAYHVEQANPSLQPQLVSAGTVLISDNGLPMLTFSDDSLENIDLRISQAYTLMTVLATNVAAQDEPTNYILSQGTFATGKIKGLFLENDNDLAAANGFSSQSVVPSNLALNSSYLLEYVYNQTTLASRIFLDSVQRSTTFLAAATGTDTQPFVIGKNSSANNSFASMNVQEIRVYNRTLADTFRQSLETNINNYFTLF